MKKTFRPNRQKSKHSGPSFRRDEEGKRGKPSHGSRDRKPQRDDHKSQRDERKPQRDERTPARDERRPKRDERKPQRDYKKPQRDDRKPKRQEAPIPPAREHSGTVLIWGLHAARAAWLNPKRRCYRLWLTEAGQDTFERTIVEAEDQLLKRPTVKHTDRQELDRLTPPGSVHQGILVEAEPLHEPRLHDLIAGDNPPDLLLMLDQVTDPHNVGAILRSAAAFGAGAIILTERNAPGMTGVLAKSASGALEHVPQIHVVNLARALDELREEGYWCVGLAEEGERDLGAIDLTGRTVLVLGAEGEGMRQLTRKKCDELARLPTGGPIGSLNVSNAAAVALYEVRRQKKLASG